MAKVMDALLGYSLEKRVERPPLGLLPNPFILENPWDNLRKSFDHTIYTDINAIQERPEYTRLKPMVRTVGKLEPGRQIELGVQLWAGAQTAAMTNYGLLRGLPAIMKHFDPQVSPDRYASIARKSLVLPTSLARRSVNSLMGASLVLGIREDKPFDPKFFRPIFRDGSLMSLAFEDLENQALPEKLPVAVPNFKNEIAFVPEHTSIKDIPEHEAVVIGCPITLLPKRLAEVWSWNVDTVEQKGLWEQTTQ